MRYFPQEKTPQETKRRKKENETDGECKCTG